MFWWSLKYLYVYFPFLEKGEITNVRWYSLGHVDWDMSVCGDSGLPVHAGRPRLWTIDLRTFSICVMYIACMSRGSSIKVVLSHDGVSWPPRADVSYSSIQWRCCDLQHRRSWRTNNSQKPVGVFCILSPVVRFIRSDDQYGLYMYYDILLCFVTIKDCMKYRQTCR